MNKLVTKVLKNFADSTLRDEVSRCHYYLYQPVIPQYNKIVKKFKK